MRCSEGDPLPCQLESTLSSHHVTRRVLTCRSSAPPLLLLLLFMLRSPLRFLPLRSTLSLSSLSPPHPPIPPRHHHHPILTLTSLFLATSLSRTMNSSLGPLLSLSKAPGWPIGQSMIQESESSKLGQTYQLTRYATLSSPCSREQSKLMSALGTTRKRRTDEHAYSCSCPAWRFGGGKVTERTCKHLRKMLGDE